MTQDGKTIMCALVHLQGMVMLDEMEDDDADSRWVTDTEDSVSQKRLTCETRYQGKGRKSSTASSTK